MTYSDFRNNQGTGIDFQNYGNFNDNTFATSGAQTVGITGYLANGGSTLVGNVSTCTGRRSHRRWPTCRATAASSPPEIRRHVVDGQPCR